MIIKTYQSLSTIKCNCIVSPGCDPYCGFSYMYIKTVLQWFFSRRVHWYGFSPVWVLICVTRLLVLENALSHWVHRYGFSPVWVIICQSRLLFHGNAALHRVHWYGFSPVWVITCLSRLLFIENVFFTQGPLIWFLPCMSHHMLV